MMLQMPFRPWVTYVLVALCVGYFLCMTLQGVHWLDPQALDILSWGGNFGPLTLTGDRWRLLSSVFMHIGVLHLLINLYSLTALGQFTELLYGRISHLALFLLTGVAGSLASAQWNLPAALSLAEGGTQLPQIAAGASGAIFGLGGALLINARWPDPRQAFRVNFKPLLIVLLLNLGLGFGLGGVDNAAHLGGLLAGLLIGGVYALSQRRPDHSGQLLRAAGLIALVGILIVWLGWLEQQAQPLEPLRPVFLAELGQRVEGFRGLH